MAYGSQMFCRSCSCQLWVHCCVLLYNNHLGGDSNGPCLSRRRGDNACPSCSGTSCKGRRSGPCTGDLRSSSGGGRGGSGSCLGGSWGGTWGGRCVHSRFHDTGNPCIHAGLKPLQTSPSQGGACNTGAHAQLGACVGGDWHRNPYQE